MATEIAAVLQRTGLAPQWLKKEPTGPALMHPSCTAHEAPKAPKALGMRLSIGDFGTGYSPLACLKRHPIDRPKIERSFVTGAPGGADGVAIATAIVRMARGLALQTVAEGVETAARVDWLRSPGCNMVPGYTSARSMKAGQARHWLKPGGQGAGAGAEAEAVNR